MKVSCQIRYAAVSDKVWLVKRLKQSEYYSNNKKYNGEEKNRQVSDDQRTELSGKDFYVIHSFFFFVYNLKKWRDV